MEVTAWTPSSARTHDLSACQTDLTGTRTPTTRAVTCGKRSGVSSSWVNPKWRRHDTRPPPDLLTKQVRWLLIITYISYLVRHTKTSVNLGGHKEQIIPKDVSYKKKKINLWYLQIFKVQADCQTVAYKPRCQTVHWILRHSSMYIYWTKMNAQKWYY